MQTAQEQLSNELGGNWSYVEGAEDPKKLIASFDPDTAALLTRVFKRWNVPHGVTADGHSIGITLSEDMATGVDSVAANICDKFRKPQNNDITIKSKIADGSLKQMLDERDAGIYR